MDIGYVFSLMYVHCCLIHAVKLETLRDVNDKELHALDIDPNLRGSYEYLVMSGRDSESNLAVKEKAYLVALNPPKCTCPHFIATFKKCKHYMCSDMAWNYKLFGERCQQQSRQSSAFTTINDDNRGRRKLVLPY